MSAGAVSAKIVLDHPLKYHCGPDDPVTGRVNLTYRPPGYHGKAQSNLDELQSLFGPLKVFLTFHGRAKTKIHKSNGNSSSTYRGRAPLFRKHLKIYEGPYTSKPGESIWIPFSLNFPAATQNLPGAGDFRQSNRFCEEEGGPLPPTFATDKVGFTKRFEAFVEYRIAAEVRMPGIDVKISGTGDDFSPVVLYEQPRVPATPENRPKMQQFSHTVMLQNENLLPEDQRPVGFRQKAKFKFSSEEYPTYVFDIVSTVPKEVYIGQPLSFELSVHPNFNRCNAPLPPEIKLRVLRAGIESHVNVRSEYGFMSHEEASQDIHLPYLPVMIVDKDTPFCKANDHTKVIQASLANLDIRSSFMTYNICQRYTLEINFCIAAAGKEKWFKREVPIKVLPPMDDGGMAGQPSYSSYAEASSSATAPTRRDSKELPASPTPPKPEPGLPEYERPPEYDQVLDMTTENDEPAAHASGKGKAVAT